MYVLFECPYTDFRPEEENLAEYVSRRLQLSEGYVARSNTDWVPTEKQKLLAGSVDFPFQMKSTDTSFTALRYALVSEEGNKKLIFLFTGWRPGEIYP